MPVPFERSYARSCGEATNHRPETGHRRNARAMPREPRKLIPAPHSPHLLATRWEHTARAGPVNIILIP